MALTDGKGNPLEADDPRLPKPEETERLVMLGDHLVAALQGATGQEIGPAVEFEARLAALVTLFVPPDGPTRRLFDHRAAQARVDILARLQREVRDAQAPRLVVASSLSAVR